MVSLHNHTNAVHGHLACLSQSAESRMSASLMLLFELEYMNKLQCDGWNSVAVMTSVSSSILIGLMSTMSRSRQDIAVRKTFAWQDLTE